MFTETSNSICAIALKTSFLRSLNVADSRCCALPQPCNAQLYGMDYSDFTRKKAEERLGDGRRYMVAEAAEGPTSAESRKNDTFSQGTRHGRAERGGTPHLQRPLVC